MVMGTWEESVPSRESQVPHSLPLYIAERAVRQNSRRAMVGSLVRGLVKVRLWVCWSVVVGVAVGGWSQILSAFLDKVLSPALSTSLWKFSSE